MKKILDLFNQKIADKTFPCIGAKTALCKKTIDYIVIGNMASDDSSYALHQKLVTFTERRESIDRRFATFIAIFDDNREVHGNLFERLLWLQLKKLAELDGHKWDFDVSCDVNLPNFSFSVHGSAYFIIGLCPQHERKSRAFHYPALVFNSHKQFEYLKKIKQFDVIQRNVRQREILFHGSTNPNLADFGKNSEACQYSGFKKAPSWECPVRFDS